MWGMNEKEAKILAKIRQHKSKRPTAKRKKIIKTSKDKSVNKILSIIKSKEKATVRLGKIINYLNDI